MKVFHTYRSLDLVGKATVWGTIASIVSVLVAVALPPASPPVLADSGGQTTHGPQSPAVKNERGDVNINYSNGRRVDDDDDLAQPKKRHTKEADDKGKSKSQPRSSEDEQRESQTRR